MAEVPSPMGGTMFKTEVVKNGVRYEISTVDTFDAGWETLLFRAGGGYAEEGAAYERRHLDYNEAKAWHEHVEKEFTRA